MSLPEYTSPRPGTYKTAAATGKLDYLSLSTDLQARVRQADVNRRGYYSSLWERFEDIKAAPTERRGLLQASEHHCLWADLDLDWFGDGTRHVGPRRNSIGQAVGGL